MVRLLTRDGHDWGAPNLDSLAVFYITFVILYTVSVFSALLVLHRHRNTVAVRLRGFASICWTVLSLHAYLILIFIAYPLNGLYKCGIEFWVMNTLLPVSMALFQASNIRLLSYYEEQKMLAKSCLLDDRHGSNGKFVKNSLLTRWRRLSTVEQTHLCIVFGLVVQTLVSFILYFGSRRFHASYGLFSDHVNAGQCRRGFEWIPSVFWQFLWSTVFGPYVLVRIRKINDTHFWAWQTRLAIIACLPGTPLWLTFVYSNSPKIAAINSWFIPAGWFLPGLFTMQFVSLFFPLWDAHKNKSSKSILTNDSETTIALNSSTNGVWSSAPQNRDIYSMASLEMQINMNLDPLLRWAAEKEFTAENIVFLRAVRDFKKKWANVVKKCPVLSQEQERDRFEDAAYIWFKLVNPLTARFNINIDYRTFSELEQMFIGLRYEPFEDDASASSKSSSKSDNIIAPWLDAEKAEGCRPSSPSSSTSPTQNDEALACSDVDRLYQIPITEISTCENNTNDGGDLNYKVPTGFSVDVFDKAFETVKNDVFLNTWVRYEARFSRPHIAAVNNESFCARVSSQPCLLKRIVHKLNWTSV